MSDVVETLRRKQREWLRDVLDRHGIAPTRLAKQVGLTPTTITRKLNAPSDTTILSEANVARIAAYLGEAPPNFVGSAAASIGFREREAEPYVIDQVDHPSELIGQMCNRPGVDAWHLNSRALEYEGYRPGDILIVDLNAQPQAGDVVCAQLYDWQRPGGTLTVFRLYEPPYLIGAGPEEAARKPRLIDSEGVAIKGVVLMSIRSRMNRMA